ncbi:neuropeptide CCHamide 1 isoform X1 [Lycorma delicatula]|uniref:neuropeptide CCHamide 1 isoform X1 n=1 Tax=Lycorma delicatula TaxID=130591 RepID=UPI003F51681F
MILPPSICSLALLCYLAASAAGSCLSYGHSCWGAHGKRSGGGVALDDEDTRWFISRLAPASQSDPINFRSHKPPQMSAPSPDWFQPQEFNPISRQRADTGDSLIMPDETDFSSPDSQDDREIIVMEQPPRLYKILNHAAGKLDFKSSLQK